MGSKFLAHLRRQWMGALALFLVLTGGTAYAANTVFSTDIVNDQVYSADVRNDTLTGGGLAAADLRSGSVGTAEIGDNQVRSADVRDDSLSGGGLAAADLAGNSVGSGELANGALTGQIDGPHVVSSALNTGTGKEVTVPCPESTDDVTGGGFVISGPGGSNVPSVAIQRSYAVDNHTWLVRAVATSGTPEWQLTGIATCAF